MSLNNSNTVPGCLFCLGSMCIAGGVIVNATQAIDWIQSGFVPVDWEVSLVTTIAANVVLAIGIVSFLIGVRENHRRRERE